MYRGESQRKQQRETWGLQRAMMRIPGPKEESSAERHILKLGKT